MAGIYIHIPFCKKRCIYCDFYSNTQFAYREKYVNALLEEIRMRREYLDSQDIKTIYFGGGTPTSLSCNDLQKILNELAANFRICNPEITIEANPDNLSESYIKELKLLSVNRLSIGIQSFDDGDLLFLNRRHTAENAIRAVKRCKDEGFDNISIDLIYGLPNQTVAKWEYNIQTALELDIQHISAYCLSYEKGTVLYDLKEKGKIQPVEDELNERFYKMLIKKLTENGYFHYEISNFAKQTPDFPAGIVSKHNSSYWKGTPYLGLGAAAHSYNGTSRSWNVASIGDYINSITKEHELPLETEYPDERMIYNDYIITRLRTMYGISLHEFETLFGTAQKEELLHLCEKFIKHNLLTINENHLKLTDSGIFISDAILRELMRI